MSTPAVPTDSGGRSAFLIPEHIYAAKRARDAPPREVLYAAPRYPPAALSTRGAAPRRRRRRADGCALVVCSPRARRAVPVGGRRVGPRPLAVFSRRAGG